LSDVKTYHVHNDLYGEIGEVADVHAQRGDKACIEATALASVAAVRLHLLLASVIPWELQTKMYTVRLHFSYFKFARVIYLS